MNRTMFIILENSINLYFVKVISFSTKAAAQRLRGDRLLSSYTNYFSIFKKVTDIKAYNKKHKDATPSLDHLSSHNSY